MSSTSDLAVVLGTLASGVLAGLLVAIGLDAVVEVPRRRAVIAGIVLGTCAAAVVFWAILGYSRVAEAARLPLG